jgi:hexosaminidase
MPQSKLLKDTTINFLSNYTMKKFILSILLLCSILVNAQHNIIPIPVSYESTDITFNADSSINLDYDSKNNNLSFSTDQLKTFLEAKGFEVSINKKKATTNIIIKIAKKEDEQLGNEGYKLTVGADDIALTANKTAGVFNGIQTLKQLFFEAESGKAKINGCSIVDYPRFKWRGLMLDVSRHFFPADDVKKYIDKMAEYKFNVFHWHLTDDEGWRIEIKSLPKLTEKGAWRVERHGKFGEKRPFPKEGEKPTYGGFYTQEEIKDIVKYAADRNITIVPEIDVPGHSMAALAAYPELSTKKEPKFVNPGSKFAEWYSNGKFKMLIENTVNPTDEKVYDFLDKVFTEVAELFPGEYIHMGGDEAYHGFWDEDESVQKFMKKNKIKDSHHLQSYFVKRVEKIINSKGKKMIGWDEILEGGLAKSATVMSWRGMDGGIEAAKMGHEVVMSPTTYVYIDYSQGDNSLENVIYAHLSLQKTYDFEPVPDGIDPKYILGGQGNLWSEAVPTIQFAFYMTYPRALSISETLWSPKNHKDWDSFVSRVETHFDVFDKQNVNISKAVYDPIVKVYNEDGKLMCELSNNIANTEIYYSVNNTYPVKFASKYEAPFEIPEGDLRLRTQTFREGKPIGRELVLSRELLLERAKK